MKKIGVGLIGVGDHNVRSHLKPLLAIDGAEIRWMYDINIERMEQLKNEYGLHLAKIFTNEDELLSDPDIQAVIIGTPDRFHADSMMKAAEHGKHALVEKPLAHCIEEFNKVEQAIEIFQKKWLIMTSCHPRRFDPPFLRLKDNLKRFTEQYGPVIDVTCDFSYHKPSKQWLHSWMLDDHYNHEIDLLSFLVGLESYSAQKLYNDDIRYNAAGQRADGISFYFKGTRMLENGIFPEFFTVRFAKGDIRIDTKTWLCHTHDHDNIMQTIESCGKTNYEERFRWINQNFIDAINGNAKNYLSYEEMKMNTLSWLHLTKNGTYTYNK